MNRYDILHMIPRIAVTPSKVAIGGSTASLLALVQAQRSSGHAVSIISGTLSSDGEIASVLGAGVDLTNLPMRGRPVSYQYGLEYVLRTALKASAFRTKNGNSLVHGHSGRWEYALATRVLARRIDRPWIHTLYCPVPSNGAGAASKPLLLRGILAGARAIVGISQNIVSSVERAGVPRSRLLHIDPCLNIDRYSPSGNGSEVRRKLEIPDDAQVVLFVGNPKESKGFDLLWDAFCDLILERRGIYLVATFEWHGRSWRGRAVERFGRAVTDRVRFLGVVEDMPSLMEASDVLVLPFRDTFGPSDYPIPMLEAMAIGTPVVASDVGGISEVITPEETGVLVPSANGSALADSLKRILDDAPMRSRISAAAREMIHQRFTPEIAADNWEKMYGRL